MATVKYLLQSASDNAQIYLRLSLGRSKSIKRKTGLATSCKDWSAKTGLPKQNNANNKKLSSSLKSLEAFIQNELNEANSTGVEVDGNWLLVKIEKHFNRVTPTDLNKLVNYANHFLKNLQYRVTEQGKKGVAIATYKKYKTILNKLIAFEKYSKTQYLVKNVDRKFRASFIDYLKEEENLGDNTIGRYLKFVKSICLDAAKSGLEISNKLEHFKGFTVKAPKVVLSFDELEQIKNTKFSNENHDIARDWLIIGCYTGQRVSDLLRMESSFIESIQKFKFIVLEQIKTGKTVQIPIHEEVKKILDKRNGEFPPTFTKNADSNMSLFNRYLKQLSKLAKINSVVEGNAYNAKTKRTENGKYEKHLLVSSHICRRSFATNFYGDPKYPTPLLMNITAHSTEKMFLEYIGKKPIDYGLQLAKIWANEALKKEKKPQLKIVKKVSVNNYKL